MKIGIVNDMPLAVAALRRALAAEPTHSVLWEAANGVEAVSRCAAETPDLLLMDLLMPEMNGAEAVRRIMTATPCAILLVTSDIDRNMNHVFEAMGHGAMDVVRTPALGQSGHADVEALLKKINNIGWLVGQGVRRRKPSAGEPGPGAKTGTPLVAIGASAGGPVALESLLRQLPADFAGAVVIVQHVDSIFAADMAAWLGTTSALPVRLAREGDRPSAGEVLLAGTGDHLRVSPDCTLAYSSAPQNYVYRPSIDVFFDSIVENWRGDAFGVLLTGMGRDGALGLKHMRENGFLTIAQDRETSAVYGMPKAAFEMGAATEILPLQQIAPRLVEALA